MTTLALEGTGTTIQFQGSGFSADLISLVISDKAREVIETSHLGTVGGKTYRPAELVDLGTIRAVFDHNPDEVNLVGRPVEQVVIRYPDTADRTFDPLVITGAVIRQGGQRMWLDERMVTTVTIQIMPADVVVVTASEPPLPPIVVLPEAQLWGFDDAWIGEDFAVYRQQNRSFPTFTVT